MLVTYLSAKSLQLPPLCNGKNSVQKFLQPHRNRDRQSSAKSYQLLLSIGPNRSFRNDGPNKRRNPADADKPARCVQRSVKVPIRYKYKYNRSFRNNKHNSKITVITFRNNLNKHHQVIMTRCMTSRTNSTEIINFVNVHCPFSNANKNVGQINVQFSAFHSAVLLYIKANSNSILLITVIILTLCCLIDFRIVSA